MRPDIKYGTKDVNEGNKSIIKEKREREREIYLLEKHKEKYIDYKLKNWNSFR